MLGILSYQGWLIQEAFARLHAPIVFKAIQNGTLELFIQKNRAANDQLIAGIYNGLEADFAGVTVDEPRWYTTKVANGAKVAIIPMQGAITKNGDMCSYGMRDYQNVISRIEKDATISGVVFHINNGPGGTVDGTPEMAGMIKSMTKGTIAFVDGFAASAHYWMASQTDHIMMSAVNPSEVGSIGALLVYQNVQNMIAAGQMPDMEIIRAPQSTDKALLNPIEGLTTELRKELSVELKAAVVSFIDAVKGGRPSLKDDSVFTGKMYSMKEALSNGLADSKGTLMEAVNKVARMGKQKSTDARKAQVNSSMKFIKLSNLFSGEAWSKVLDAMSAEGLVTLEASEKKLADAEASAEAVAVENVSLKTTIDQLTADAKVKADSIASLTATVTERDAQVASLTTEKSALEAANATLKTELANKPTGQATTVISKEEQEAAVNADGKESATKPETTANKAAREIREFNAKNSTIK